MGVRRYGVACGWLAFAILVACSPQTSGADAAQPVEEPAAVAATPKVSPFVHRLAPTQTKPDAAWLHAPRPPTPTFLAAQLRQPIIPTSWTIANWCVDPSAGSDANSCTDCSHACKTFAEIAARWGTYCPRIRQTTTITFNTSQTDNTDPVYLCVKAENNASFVIVGTLGAAQQVATGTLSSVTAKNRATPQLFQASLGGSAAVGQLVHATHTSTTASFWVYALVSGTTFKLTQPIVVDTVPAAGTATELDTLTTGDAFTLYSPVQVNIVDVENQVSDLSPQTYIQNLTALDPTCNGCFDYGFLGHQLFLRDVFIQRFTVIAHSFLNFFYNVYSPQGLLVESSPLDFNLSANAISIIAGEYGGELVANGSSFDGDVILNGGDVSGQIEDVYVETSTTINVGQSSAIGTNSAYSTPGILWGPGTVNVQGSSRAVYTSGASNGAATFKISHMKINGSTTANSECAFTGHSGIAISGANLDAACGAAGFGGLALQLGGAAITNGSL